MFGLGALHQRDLSVLASCFGRGNHLDDVGPCDLPGKIGSHEMLEAEPAFQDLRRCTAQRPALTGLRVMRDERVTLLLLPA